MNSISRKEMPQKNEEKTPKNSSFFVKGNTFFRAIWWIVRVIWYWLERIFLIAFLLTLTAGLAWWLSQKPSLQRDWEEQDARLPTISWSGNTVFIDNIRNHNWTSDTDFTPNYLSEIYDINTINSLYYIITPFSDKDGPAHVMLSFGFEDGRKVVISGEIRKERGESFDILKGVMNQYELQYVIATEEDVIKLRTNYRNNTVIMYPVETPREYMSHIFRSMLIRADKFNSEPEFYNTFWNNCTTSLLMHANALRKEKISWNKYLILPSHSDEILYKEGLIKTNLSLSDARAYYTISDIAKNAPENADFSEIIRKSIQ